MSASFRSPEAAFLVGREHITPEAHHAVLARADKGLFALIDNPFSSAIATEIAGLTETYLGDALDRMVQNVLKTSRTHDEKARLINVLVNTGAAHWEQIIRGQIRHRSMDAHHEVVPAVVKLIHLPDASARVYVMQGDEGAAYVLRVGTDFFEPLDETQTHSTVSADSDQHVHARYVDVQAGDRVLCVNAVGEARLTSDAFQDALSRLSLSASDDAYTQSMHEIANHQPRGESETGDPAFLLYTIPAESPAHSSASHTKTATRASSTLSPAQARARELAALKSLQH